MYAHQREWVGDLSDRPPNRGKHLCTVLLSKRNPGMISGVTLEYAGEWEKEGMMPPAAILAASVFLPDCVIAVRLGSFCVGDHQDAVCGTVGICYDIKPSAFRERQSWQISSGKLPL